jgi:signal peptide peptidase SppA
MNYQHIAARALNRPLLLEPGYARFFFAALGPRMGISILKDVEGKALDKDAQLALCETYLPRDINPWTGQDETDNSYPIVNGVAVISITGTLVHNGGYVGSKSGSMCYDGIQSQLASAEGNSAVKGVMLKFDTPGGEVSGIQSLGTVINNFSKPIWGHANEQAASGGMWLISACDRVLLTETAEMGSIGVVMAHGDYSKALEGEGIAVTLIYEGSHKVDGNPYEPLPAAVQAEMQADLKTLRTLFASTVASNRGIPTAQVMATEARMYRGQLAVDQGLADSVMSFDDALATFSQTLANRGGSLKGKPMSKLDTNASPAAAGEGNPITAEAHASAAATASATARAEGHAAGVLEGTAAGATQERARISAILTHASATGREATAREFALNTNMSAEDATRVLASVPATTSASALAAATLTQMAAADQVKPEAGAGAGSEKLTLAQRNAAAKGR